MTNNNPHQKFNAAFIGLGRMGASHAQAVKEIGWNITAILDKDSNRTKEIASQYNLPNSACFSDVAELLKQKIDFLIIATTADSHCDLVCQAAESGIPYILCEKPMATSLSDCDKMIKSCQASGSLLAINHQMRFMTQYTLVKKCLQGSRFGKLTSMNVVGGSFGLCMNGSHYVEAFSFLSGSPLSCISSWFSEEMLQNPRGKQFKDQGGQIRLLSSSGQRFNLEAGNDQGHGMTVMYATEYGHIFVDELAGEFRAVVRQEEYLTFPKTRYGLPTDKVKKNFPVADNVSSTKEVLLALASRDNYPSGEDGRQVVNALVAAHHSAENNNQRVSLNDSALSRARRFPWA